VALSIQQRAAHFERPELFSKTFLLRKLWAKQQEIARSVAANPLTAVKGCHASGKTFVASGLPLWWITRYRQAVAYVIAPTQRQVKTFWGEIHMARLNAAPALRQILPEPLQLSLHISPDRYAAGASSSRGVNVQGLHGKNVLLIGDEAPGIEAEIWDAIHGIRAGGNVRFVTLGNPVIPTGEFFDSFHRGRSIWNCISISAFDTPNLQHETEGRPLTIEELMTMPAERLEWCPFPALITRAWVAERYRAWGPSHPKYMSRVLAQFPTQADNAVFALAWIEKAKRDPTDRELAEARKHVIQVGIDVAGAGSDETVLVARVAGIILELHAWPDADPLLKVIRVLGRLRAHPLYRLGTIVVDIVGIGYNFALRLADHGFRDNLFGHIAGAAPQDKSIYADQKAETTFQAREWFKAGLISGLGTLTRDDETTEPEEETEAQLATMLYRETNRGTTEIVPKKEMLRLHNVPSPDRAEALVMAFMHVVIARERVDHYEPVEISRY
jgi:hypothetical protein